MNAHTFARMAGTRQVLMRRHVLGALTLAASVLLLGASTAWASGGPAEFEAFTEWSALESRATRQHSVRGERPGDV
jgi:hypothetical protein